MTLVVLSQTVAQQPQGRLPARSGADLSASREEIARRMACGKLKT